MIRLKPLLQLAFAAFVGLLPATVSAATDGEPAAGSADRIALWPQGMAPGDKPLVQAQRIVERARPPAAQLTVTGDRGALVSVDDRLVGALPLVRPLSTWAIAAGTSASV